MTSRKRFIVPQAPRSRKGASVMSSAGLAGLWSRLALRVLETLAGARLAVLLALFLAGVAGQVPGSLEDAPPLRILGDERAGDAVAHGFRLSAVPAAGDG